MAPLRPSINISPKYPHTSNIGVPRGFHFTYRKYRRMDDYQNNCTVEIRVVYYMRPSHSVRNDYLSDDDIGREWDAAWARMNTLIREQMGDLHKRVTDYSDTAPRGTIDQSCPIDVSFWEAQPTAQA